MELRDRSRLMALVFGLRLLLTGIAFLIGSALLILLRLSSSLEWQSLLFLFSLFIVLVSLVLLFVRFSRHASRLLLLAPLAALAGETWLLAPGAVLFLEAFRREAGGAVFLPAQIVWILSTLLLAGESPLAVPGFVLAGGLFATGCLDWQRRIKEEMRGLDQEG